VLTKQATLLRPSPAEIVQGVIDNLSLEVPINRIVVHGMSIIRRRNGRCVQRIQFFVVSVKKNLTPQGKSVTGVP
jgi:hypothetical protein